jgi:antitoxin (DNA-binding transcriptional repressor) of toxin-antitoxin stability system
MTAIGSYEAKTHLPELLERVEKGEKIVITRRGVPVALLTQPPTRSRVMCGKSSKRCSGSAISADARRGISPFAT